MKKEPLTSEDLRLIFVNQFSLCLFSIDIAQKMIKSGQPASLSDVLAKTRELAVDYKATKKSNDENTHYVCTALC